MHSVQIHKVIRLIISLFYRTGVWHHGAEPTMKETRLKIIHCTYLLLFLISTVSGAIYNEKIEMSIILSALSLAIVVLGIKIWILVWKQNEIIDLINRIGVFTIQNDEDYNRCNEKLYVFMKFVFFFVITAVIGAVTASVILSVVGAEKTLFLEIGFPVDYKNNELGFWLATIFIFIGFLLVMIAILFTVIIWYLLLNCSLRYEVLGNDLKRMGRRSVKIRGVQGETQTFNDFAGDLNASIKSHVQISELTQDLKSFFSEVFFIQFNTSGLCICGSIYCLAFNIGDSLLEHVLYLVAFLYFVADIFMITYFGNEIMLSSDRLSYSLFESDWYDRPQSTKKDIIIFGEYLKQPKQLLVGKLYLLTLETFTRILNSAYSMFNILKSFQL